MCIAVVFTACAPRRIAFPTDPGVPLPDVQQLHARLAAACTGVRTLTAEVGLSGRAGDQRLRGRVIAGFELPASMRLEAVALGRPVFMLAARGGTATLLLPRESRVLRGASPDAVLDALIGVQLAPDDLQAILTGCVVPRPRAVAGRLHDDDWASIVLESPAAGAPATLYLRRDEGEWQLRGAVREGWRVEYPAWSGGFPQTVRLLSDAGGMRVDLIATIDQLETNVDIDPAAFTIDAPPDALPLTLEELRESGPLSGE